MRVLVWKSDRKSRASTDHQRGSAMVEMERLARELMRRNPRLTLDQAVEQVKQTPKGRSLWFAFTHANPVDDTNRDYTDPTYTTQVTLAEDRTMKQMDDEDEENDEDADKMDNEQAHALTSKQLSARLDQMADAAKRPDESFERAYARLAENDKTFKAIYSKLKAMADSGPMSADYYPQGSGQRLNKRERIEPIFKAEDVEVETHARFEARAAIIFKHALEHGRKITKEQAYVEAMEQDPECYTWHALARAGQPYVDYEVVRRYEVRKAAEAQ